MKLYHKNPRQITEKQFTDLGGSLSRLGDLSGIVHDLNSDEVIGGNQRSRIFDINKCDIQLVEQYAEPDEQGTVGIGFVIWKGKKYAYRQVRWTPKQCEEANIRANAAGGDWDFDDLANEWELDDLLEWGIDKHTLDLDLWAGEPKDDPGAQIDKAEELREKWGVESGQLWRLGEHRLICGDCTDRATVERVMGGEKARTVFTDPPYGIGKEIENDNLKREDWTAFYTLFTGNMLDFAIVNAYVFVWGYFDTLSNYWQEVIKPRGDCNFRNFIIWRKKNIQGRNAQEFRQFPEEYEAALVYIFGQPFQNGPWSTSPNAEYYPEIFEPIRAYLDGERQKMGWDIPAAKKIVGHSDLSRDHWFGRSQWTMPTREVYEAFQKAARGDAFRKDYDELRKDYDELRGYFDNSNGFTDLWEFEHQTLDARHPTVKPVEVCERGIITTSQKDEIILDVFLGSGTTLIACERLNRKCRAVEISPAYCAVAIQRWVDMTGGTPELMDEE